MRTAWLNSTVAASTPSWSLLVPDGFHIRWTAETPHRHWARTGGRGDSGVESHTLNSREPNIRGRAAVEASWGCVRRVMASSSVIAPEMRRGHQSAGKRP